MFVRQFRWPKEAVHSAFQGMENENDEDDSHFDVHSSDSSSRMGPVEDADIDFLQLRVDASLSGPERVQVFQVSIKESEHKSNLFVDSSQLPRFNTSKEPTSPSVEGVIRQIEIIQAFDDSQPDTRSTESLSTISGMPSLFDQVDDIYVSATRPSTLGANITPPSANTDYNGEESRFRVLTCCLRNRGKSPRAAWFRQLPLVAKIGVGVLVMLFVVSISTIVISVAVMGNHDSNDESDPSSTGRAEISATIPTNLSTVMPVASFTDSPTSSPVSIPTVSPTTTNTNADTTLPVFLAICADDTAAAFAVDTRVTRDCAWLSESLAFQVLLCRPGQGAFEFCRETCNNCPT
jgi:hypothetical protein